MRCGLVIPEITWSAVMAHLFQNELEQGAFLFAEARETPNEIHLEVRDAYLIPPEGWRTQLEVYLEMKDAERARIMKMARAGGFAIVDCHSHPGSGDDVWFSPSDQSGITDFAEYARWKLDGKPYVAMVWGESSIDGVVWYGNFAEGHLLDEVCVVGNSTRTHLPKGTWFQKPRSYWRRRDHAI